MYAHYCPTVATYVLACSLSFKSCCSTLPCMATHILLGWKDSIQSAVFQWPFHPSLLSTIKTYQHQKTNKVTLKLPHQDKSVPLNGEGQHNVFGRWKFCVPMNTYHYHWIMMINSWGSWNRYAGKSGRHLQNCTVCISVRLMEQTTLILEKA